MTVGPKKWLGPKTRWTNIRVDGRTCVLLQSRIGEDPVLDIVLGQEGIGT